MSETSNRVGQAPSRCDRIQSLLREVNRSHAGHPRSIVYAHLCQRFNESGLAPNEPAFSGFVDAITKGNLRL
jgi:hypothetical protein